MTISWKSESESDICNPLVTCTQGLNSLQEHTNMTSAQILAGLIFPLLLLHQTFMCMSFGADVQTIRTFCGGAYHKTLQRFWPSENRVTCQSVQYWNSFFPCSQKPDLYHLIEVCEELKKRSQGQKARQYRAFVQPNDDDKFQLLKSRTLIHNLKSRSTFADIVKRARRSAIENSGQENGGW